MTMRFLVRALALFSLLVSSFAQAQTKPPDVPDPVAVPGTYASGTTLNKIGDGTGTHGSPMPVLAYQLDDIPTTAEGWSTTSGVSALECGGGETNDECKARFTSDTSHVLFDDPIRNYGDPGASHCHQFFGSTSVNAYSTYASLRNRANEWAASGDGLAPATTSGGPLNATGYWFPCVVKEDPFADGKNYVVKAKYIIIYYTVNPGTKARYTQRLPRGLRYILGTNMDDPLDGELKGIIAAANAQPGTSGRYAYANNGFLGYKCYDSSGTNLIPTADSNTHSKSFKNADGSDPWGGACTADMLLAAEVHAPECYDGTNLWVPGGYNHLRQAIGDTQENRVGIVGGACPDGWYRVPQLIIVVYLQHQGFADYGTWRLDSDDMMQAKIRALAVAGTSGYEGQESAVVLSGESFHTDWFGAWDDATFLSWQEFCTGVDGETPHACDFSTISATHRLITNEAAPDGSRTPQQGGKSFDTSDPTDMFEMPANKGQGPATIHAHGD